VVQAGARPTLSATSGPTDFTDGNLNPSRALHSWFAIWFANLTAEFAFMITLSWKRIAIVLALILGLVLVCAGLVVADVTNLGFSLF